MFINHIQRPYPSDQASALSLDDFQYDLPTQLIAQVPLDKRDDAKLLVASLAKDTFEHRQFFELAEILPEGTLLIVNDSKVLAARLFACSDGGAEVELLLTQRVPPQIDSSSTTTWRAIGKPFKKIRKSTKLFFAQGLDAKIVDCDEAQDSLPEVVLEFACSEKDLQSWLNVHGVMPLPPYIDPRRSVSQQEKDRLAYQTIYAEQPGSVAAPTAGLHFTPTLLEKLRQKKISLHPVCLHVGLGTFLPVKTQDISLHRMHSEHFLVPSSTLTAMTQASEQKRSVVFVGTTVLRCLESFYLQKAPPDKILQTELFLYPKNRDDLYRPWLASGLITNFHQPQSSLLMLVSLVLGFEKTKKLYAEAIARQYRFFSFGDTSLLWF